MIAVIMIRIPFSFQFTYNIIATMCSLAQLQVRDTEEQRQRRCEADQQRKRQK